MNHASMTDRFDVIDEPQTDPQEADRLEATWRDPPGFLGVFAAINHKTISRRFMTTTFGFFVAGGILALVMRLQLRVRATGLSAPTCTTSCSRCTAPR